MGKIYGGLLILENWKATKFGKVAMSEAQVSGMMMRDDVNKESHCHPGKLFATQMVALEPLLEEASPTSSFFFCSH